MTLEDLFIYADGVRARGERAGKSLPFPTVRQCARRFKVPQDAVVAAVEDARLPGRYLGLGVAIGCNGRLADLVGGDQLVEAHAIGA